MSTSLPADVSADDILLRICAEYVEMPGLRVTHLQAQRLWGLDAETCLAALERLTELRFLCKTPNHLYARLTDGPATVARFRMAKADLDQKGTRRIAI